MTDAVDLHDLFGLLEEPAILLARKLANGGITQRGAFPCTGFLTLPEFEREFARWRITTVMREQSAG